MGTINVSLPSDGTTADVADFNTPINTIVNEINGNLDNENIGTSAGISGTKLADNSIDLTAKSSSFDGWVKVNDSWAFASATTVTVPSDATAKYSVGDKIKFDQTTTKYFLITAVSSTVLTLAGVGGTTVANSAISNIYYSKAETPLGFSGAWLSWTPTWTNLSVGNGSATYKYIQRGKTVDFRVEITLGSTSTVGAASFTPPVAAAATTDGTPVGMAHYLDNGVGWFLGSVWESGGNFALLLHGAAGTYLSVGAISSTTPFTWASTDIIVIRGSYEAA